MENHNFNQVPVNNLIAYNLLFAIEVGLREFIIAILSKDNPLWWKQRLSNDLLTKFKDGKEYEKNIKWMDLVPHHPLYYLDFPDLKKIIERNDNWRDVFQQSFSDKEVFSGLIQGIQPIRNKIAHHRIISSKDLSMLKTMYQALSSSIGEKRYLDFIKNQSTAVDIPERLENLNKLLVECHGKCVSLEPISDIKIWREINKNWWFDTDYIGTDLSPIIEYFELIEEYSGIPRYRGSGFFIEEWINNHNEEEKFQMANNTLISLINM